MTFVVEGLVHFPESERRHLDRFCADFEEIELPVLVSSELGLAGAWTLSSDTGTDLLHLYGPVSGLADLTASAKRIGQLPDGHAYHRLYEWLTGPAVTYSRTVRPLVDPVDVGWWDRLVAGGPATQPYFVATCRYGLTGESTFRAPLPGALEALAADDRASLALAYDTLFGDFGSTRVIGTAGSLADFESVLDDVTRRSADSRSPWVTYPATPTAYSPVR